MLVGTMDIAAEEDYFVITTNSAYSTMAMME